MTSSSTDCATITISGQMYAQKKSIALLRRRQRTFSGGRLRQRRAFGHDGGRARDRIGKIEVADRGSEGRLFGGPAQLRELGYVTGIAGRDFTDPHHVGVGREQFLTQGAKGIER